MHAVATALNTLQTELNGKYLEREEAITAVLLALLTKEHVLQLGPPGTAKSELNRDIAAVFTGADYFEVMMSKQRSADAVFGPIDIPEFRENGHMFRKSKGFMQTSHFTMIDEIGKMNPILGHDMLAMVNERLYHEVNGGRSAHKIPLHTVFAASNEELTADASDEAAALRDRLLFNVVVDYISDDKNFRKLLTVGRAPITTQILYTDLLDVAENEVPAVTHSKEAVTAVVTLRKKLRKEHIYPSDRRWRASMKAMQANAFLEGRTSTDESDLSAMRFTLWDTVAQVEAVQKLTAGASNPFVEALNAQQGRLTELAKELDLRKDLATAEQAQFARELTPKLQEVRDELDKLLTSAAGKAIPRFKDAADLHRNIMTQMYQNCFQLDEDAARAVVANKVGLGDGIPASV